MFQISTAIVRYIVVGVEMYVEHSRVSVHVLDFILFLDFFLLFISDRRIGA